MKYNEQCSCCGNRVTAYTHGLNLWLIKALDELCKLRDKKRKPINERKELNLTLNVHCNFQKLRYWGLVQLVAGGWWEPTLLWLRFWQWLEPVPNIVAAMRNEVLPYDHIAWTTHKAQPKNKYIREEKEFAYKKREDYAQERSPF